MEARTFFKVLIIALVCWQASDVTFLWRMMHAFASGAKAHVIDKSALAFYSHAEYFCETVTIRMDDPDSLCDTYSALYPLSADEYQHFTLESLKRSDYQTAALYAICCVQGRLYQWDRRVAEPFTGFLYSVHSTAQAAEGFAKAMPEVIEDKISPRNFPRAVMVELKPGQWLEVRCCDR